MKNNKKGGIFFKYATIVVFSTNIAANTGLISWFKSTTTRKKYLIYYILNWCIVIWFSSSDTYIFYGY